MMASIAILYLLLLESFLSADVDRYTEPLVKGMRGLEVKALQYTKDVFPNSNTKSNQKITRFYLFTPKLSPEGKLIQVQEDQGLRFFNPHLDTKVIVHGFMDTAKIAGWMHRMKDEFLLLGDFNVILVDWSYGNFMPYSKAASNTEKAGEEIAQLLTELINNYGAKRNKFHLIGHSLGAHVAGYVGEHISGLKRITGLDPATYLFSNASPRSKLDRMDAEFVDVIHTDGGGIGMMEAIGHVDFYPNGGQYQSGCTTSNSLQALLEHGVVEGARSVICSHMRSTLLFIDSINPSHCRQMAHRCTDWNSFSRGECHTCGPNGTECAEMGYHMDTSRDYGNFSKFFLLTASNPPFCGYEYKITLKQGYYFFEMTQEGHPRSSKEWSRGDVLHVTLYGSNNNAEVQIEGNRDHQFQESHIVFNPNFLGSVRGAIIRWGKTSISKMAGLTSVFSDIIQGPMSRPIIHSIHVLCLKTQGLHGNLSPKIFKLCVNPLMSEGTNQQGASFNQKFC